MDASHVLVPMLIITKKFLVMQMEGDWYVNRRSHISPFTNPFSGERETNINIRFIPQAEGRIDAYIVSGEI